MRRIVLALVAVFAITLLFSCMRGISPEQAANGKARCGRTYIR